MEMKNLTLKYEKPDLNNIKVKFENNNFFSVEKLRKATTEMTYLIYKI